MQGLGAVGFHLAEDYSIRDGAKLVVCDLTRPPSAS